jgi:hypothetical protein
MLAAARFGWLIDLSQQLLSDLPLGNKFFLEDTPSVAPAIVASSSESAKGEYRCLSCDHVLEVFDGSFEVLIRLTVPPVRKLH